MCRARSACHADHRYSNREAIFVVIISGTDDELRTGQAHVVFSTVIGDIPSVPYTFCIQR